MVVSTALYTNFKEGRCLTYIGREGRSLNTSLIYAKLDSSRLAAVALPWPGSAS
jgi:hypothetical protein